MPEIPVIVRYVSDEGGKVLTARMEALEVQDVRVAQHEGEEALMVDGAADAHQALDRAREVVRAALDGTNVDADSITLAVGLGWLR